jgi:hypothetical protein
MDRYQTFFLCGTHWNEPKKFIRFADWVVSKLKVQFEAGFDDGLACVLSATKPEDYGKRKPSFSGDYFELSSRLKEDELESFVIVAGIELQLYIKVELRHLNKEVMITDKLSDLSSDVPNGIKIVSMSVRKDVWQRCEQSGLAEEITRGWEKLFVASGALYGYIGPTHFPKADRFAQVDPAVKSTASDDEARGLPTYMRVTDFDYSRFVEGVYPINYISKVQLDNTGSRDSIVAASPDVHSRILKDADGNEVGITVELTNDSEEAKQHCLEILENLLWAPKERD